MAAEKITSASDLKTEKIIPWTWQAALETSQKRQEKEWVWDTHKAGEESKLSYSSQHSINNGIFYYDPALQTTLGWQQGKPWSTTVSRRQRLLKKRLLEKNAGSDLGVNFSQGFLLKEVFFPAKNSDFFSSSCSVLLLRQNTANTFHFLSCLVGCWGDVISELVYVSAGPYLQQNLWYMPVPPVADWIWPGKWRKPQLAELQKMNFT